MSFTLSTPKEITILMGQRVRARRLERGWSQAELAARAGIALSTLKVCERAGQVSLARLVRIMTALGHLADLDTVLTASAPASLDAMERPQRKRGRTSTLKVGGGKSAVRPRSRS
jgi:transcriptional regulator with XRE-family HTH domain